ncbi:MAG TPA: methyltransferase domain-containing protein [Streptosporangiaceae bacterium]|jgi:SAM-dependent methyltransferase
MPTLPPGQEQYSARSSHQHRDVAEAFGADAERYDRARPSYPKALIDRILAACPGADVLDIGCGTGIVARQFQAAGCQVLGVDPDARMADLARRAGLQVEVAKIEDWDPAGRCYDVAVAGQAWHWVEPVAGTARVAQALRPGGRLAVFWNAFQLPGDLGEAVAAVCRRVLPDAPMFHRPSPGAEAYATMCEKTADGIRQTPGFGDVERWRFDWERSYTRDEWLDMTLTAGFVSRFPRATLDELLADTGAAIDAAGGSFVTQFATVVVTASR